MPNQSAELVYDAKYWEGRKRFYLLWAVGLISSLPFFVYLLILQEPYSKSWILAASMLIGVFIALIGDLYLFQMSSKYAQKNQSK